MTTFDLTEVVERILDQIKFVIPYDTASVWRVDGEWQTLIISRDLPPEALASELRFLIDKDNSSRPIIHGEQPYILKNNVQEELTDFKGPHSYVNSWLAVPLKMKGKIIGLIALDGKAKGLFNEHHAELAVTFANQVAIALENASLFMNLQEELKKQIALRSASTAISSSLHVEQVLGEICKQMGVILDGTSAYIAQYDKTYSAYTVVAEYMSSTANSHELVSDLGATYHAKSGGWLFDESMNVDFVVMHAEDEDLHPQTRDMISKYGGRTILMIPLYVQGRLLGHAELWDSRIRREFTREEISFCRAISQQAAIAIANANLFEQLQRELTERKSLIAELESKNAELERFTYTVSHDLKSPLFTIRGFLGYLEQDALAGKHERVKSDMQRITAATEPLGHLLERHLVPLDGPDLLVRDRCSLGSGSVGRFLAGLHIRFGVPQGDRGCLPARPVEQAQDSAETSDLANARHHVFEGALRDLLHLLVTEACGPVVAADPGEHQIPLSGRGPRGPFYSSWPRRAYRLGPARRHGHGRF